MRFRLSIALCSLMGVLSILAGCNGISTDMDIDNAIYSWSLGCDHASFTVTSATVNGVEQLDSSVKYDDLSYNTNLSGYLTYNFDPAEDCTVVYTVKDYTAGEESYEQWVSFLTADSGQWSLRADFYSNEKISGLSNVNYYYNTYNNKNSNTYANVTLWNNQTFYIRMHWNASGKYATVQALNSGNTIIYSATAYSDDLFVTALGSENATFTISSIKVDGEETLNSSSTQSGLSYSSDINTYIPQFFDMAKDHDVVYTITDYTGGDSAYEQWLSYITTTSESSIWVARPDNWSNSTMSSFAAPTYSGPITYENTTLWNTADGESFTITYSWRVDTKTMTVTATNGTSTYTASAVKN